MNNEPKLPPLEYLRYIKDIMEDLDSEDVPHIEVEITTEDEYAPKDAYLLWYKDAWDKAAQASLDSHVKVEITKESSEAPLDAEDWEKPIHKDIGRSRIPKVWREQND